MTKNIDNYAVFGNPINHSKSPLLHATFAKQTQQNILYTAQCVDLGDFNHAAQQFFASGGKGLNVTVPFKEDAFNYADKLTSRAQRAGAVNTLFLDEDHRIVGDNTDGVGITSDIATHLGWSLKDKKVLIIGAGGAVRGILEPIINEQPLSITIVNRTLEKAKALANTFTDLCPIKVCSFSDITENVDIIINGTSASLSGDIPPIPNSVIHPDVFCYDMMYAKELTPFLQWASANGCQHYSDGLGMLVSQGAESFYIWRGVRPNTKEAIDILRKHIV